MSYSLVEFESLKYCWTINQSLIAGLWIERYWWRYTILWLCNASWNMTIFRSIKVFSQDFRKVTSRSLKISKPLNLFRKHIPQKETRHALSPKYDVINIQYVAFIDVDEIIYPLQDDRLIDLFERQYDDLTGAYIFRMCLVLWDRNISSIGETLENLLKSERLNSSQIPFTGTTFGRQCAKSHGFAPKSVVIPHKIMKMYVHYPGILVPNVTFWAVPSSTAILKHYRANKELEYEQFNFTTHPPPSRPHQTALLNAIERRLMTYAKWLMQTWMKQSVFFFNNLYLCNKITGQKHWPTVWSVTKLVFKFFAWLHLVRWYFGQKCPSDKT